MDPAGQDLVIRAFNGNGNPNLGNHALGLAAQSPELRSFIYQVSDFILALSTSSSSPGASGDLGNPKKRKLEDVVLGGHATNGSQPAGEIQPRFDVKDVSFSIPQRKKLHLEFSKEIIQLRNPASGKIEASENIRKFAYAFRLPVPEKAQKQYNYCLIPEYGEGIGRQNPNPDTTGEIILWTMGQGAPKNANVLDEEWVQQLGSSGDNILDGALNIALSTADIKLTQPNDEEFSSAIPEAHRKGETAYHVKAFRGSKDGYLFFLSNGIFFGFKKPLVFFPFDYIQSISYTSVLQRTFNLVISVSLSPDDNSNTTGTAIPDIEEFEFSMIDQADFAGIDSYIKRHELSDASMAAGRRAKKLNINKKRGADNVENTHSGSADGAGEESELQKAQQQLEAEEEDEEDEEEEDYDPGSDGDSEGSGSSDEDEDEYMHDGDDQNLVTEELGSEAEDVDVDEEEQQEDEEEDENEDDEEDELSKPSLPIQQEKPHRQQQQQNFFAPQKVITKLDEPDPYDEDQL
ncbi:putative negative regulator of dna transposition [Phaeomoniella chlamydospora]|uniref:Putative negative regulator of dna transposition n=1 Tax=Phaeomoniella chlamydospora TaxID=158046 RepID=A0A0G2F2W3_PHACM|nr:putative negative regulator of dna transposition [Phaeomoniella chlamydospora]